MQDCQSGHDGNRRVRTRRNPRSCCALQAYAIAGELTRNALIAVLVRIGTGRSEADKKRVGEGLYATLSSALMSEFASSLSRCCWILSKMIRR